MPAALAPAVGSVGSVVMAALLPAVGENPLPEPCPAIRRSSSTHRRTGDNRRLLLMDHRARGVASMTPASPPVGLVDGFRLVVEALKANDVDTIYGIVGIPITDLARAAQASGIRYLGFRQEASAGN